MQLYHSKNNKYIPDIRLNFYDIISDISIISLIINMINILYHNSNLVIFLIYAN